MNCVCYRLKASILYKVDDLRISGRNKCPDARPPNRICQFDWKIPPSKFSLPGKETFVLFVHIFGAPPVIRLPRRHNNLLMFFHLFRLFKNAQMQGAQEPYREAYMKIR